MNVNVQVLGRNGQEKNGYWISGKDPVSITFHQSFFYKITVNNPAVDEENLTPSGAFCHSRTGNVAIYIFAVYLYEILVFFRFVNEIYGGEAVPSAVSVHYFTAVVDQGKTDGSIVDCHLLNQGDNRLCFGSI